MISDFQTLFKVEADFEDEINKSDQNNKLYASLLAGLIEKYELLQFDKNAIARMIEHSARMAGDREKLSAKTEPFKSKNILENILTSAQCPILLMNE